MKITRRQLRQIIAESVRLEGFGTAGVIDDFLKGTHEDTIDNILLTFGVDDEMGQSRKAQMMTPERYRQANLDMVKEIEQGKITPDAITDPAKATEAWSNLWVGNLNMDLGRMTAGNAAWRWYLKFDLHDPPRMLFDIKDTNEFGATDVEIPGIDLYNMLKSGQIEIAPDTDWIRD